MRTPRDGSPSGGSRGRGRGALRRREQTPEAKSEPCSKIQFPVPLSEPPSASSAANTATLTAISAIVTALTRVEPRPVTARWAGAVTFLIPVGLPECSGQRSPTGAGVMHS